jgi:hypothetical protein
MFTLHTRLALQHQDLSHPAQRYIYTGDVLLCSSMTPAGPIYRRLYSIFLPRPTVIPTHQEPYDYPPPYHMVERFERVPRYVFTLQELSLTESWHSGQHSMLYAIGSTGDLTPSPLLRRHYQNNADRYYSLFLELHSELQSIITHAPSHPDVNNLHDFAQRVNFYLKRIQPRTSDE